MWTQLFYVMLGSAFGGGCRFLVSKVISENTTSPFPWPTFVVNLAGCLLIGVLFGLADRGVNLSPQMKALLITGFCGGFTTFSTFAHENYLLFGDSHFWIAFLYAVLSFALGLLFAHAGHVLAGM
ncbi:MAG: fluoride efflux transporter CrcB [Prevotella sp.]|mgnify:CR=1 FL=1